MSRKKEGLKVFHGVINVAGFPGELSRLERSVGIKSSCVVYSANQMFQNQTQDLNLGKSVLKRIFVPPFLLIKALFKFNTFHFYFGKTFLWFGLDLIVLRLFGKKIVMTYCGSEVRLFDGVDNVRNPYAYLYIEKEEEKLAKRDSRLVRKIKSLYSFMYNVPYYDRRKRHMMKWHNLFVHKFIAIRDNYAYANHVIDSNKIESRIRINNITAANGELELNHVTSYVVKVCHAPTNTILKGSQYIENAIRELQDEGLNFDYIRVQNMSFLDAKNAMIESDIVVDQLLLGGIGSVSIEAMSYGKPVVAYLMKDVIAEHCPDIPICNATIDNIKDVLRELIINENLRNKKSQEGIDYIRKYYNKEKIVNQMIDLYCNL